MKFCPEFGDKVSALEFGQGASLVELLDHLGSAKTSTEREQTFDDVTTLMGAFGQFPQQDRKRVAVFGFDQLMEKSLSIGQGARQGGFVAESRRRLPAIAPKVVVEAQTSSRGQPMRRVLSVRLSARGG